VEQRLDLYFKKVVEDMVAKKEINITNRYNSLKNLDISADFRFVVLKRYLSNENELPWTEQLIMDSYFLLKNYGSTSDQIWFGLDPGSVTVEEIPMLIRASSDVELKRV
ncbi:MAG: potassium transporter Kup, partial [Bacteroidetes bacterium]